MMALGGVLKKFRGAIGRDLIVAGYTWADVGRRMPFGQFVSFVMHPAPNTALFFERYEHWTVTDYLLADMLEMFDMLMCTKTEDPKKAFRKLKPRWRPGPPKTKKSDHKVMTVEEYAKLAGIKVAGVT